MVDSVYVTRVHALFSGVPPMHVASNVPLVVEILAHRHVVVYLVARKQLDSHVQLILIVIYVPHVDKPLVYSTLVMVKMYVHMVIYRVTYTATGHVIVMVRV